MHLVISTYRDKIHNLKSTSANIITEDKRLR